MNAIRVEVVYARPDRQFLVPLELAPGSTAADAIRASRLPEVCPEIEWPGAPLGVFGTRVDAEAELEDGDRVEIYRPLTLDPKERRRQRAG